MIQKDECEMNKLMNKLNGLRSIDLAAVSTANLFNIIMVIVFILRTMQTGHLQVVGIVWVMFIVALAIVIFRNIQAKRGRWFIVLPLLMSIFLIIEVILDYVLRSDFRNTRLLGPYLFLYYISIFGMIGYSFFVKKKYGFITLVTYFLSQFAALYSYMKVGHG